MPYLLFVVARDDAKRFEYITHQFTDEPQVEVIYDRRRAERRIAYGVHSMERRRGGDRRQRPVTGDLSTLGWVLITRPAAPAGSAEGSAC